MQKDTLIAKRYKVDKLIGQGGMADVYLAYDILLERFVAIKILRHELSKDAVSLLRFKHEAVAVSKLSHPNIIEIFDIGEYDARQFIVMEYVDGKTLKELILERGGLYLEEAVYIMKQLVSATAEAHRNHIIHRDIKSQNILVKSDGTVIITDFGIALAQHALQLTQKETVMGSVHYLAPELARGEKATYQSDIYALGIVFFELLNGSVPFKGESAIEIAMKHINDKVPSAREYNPNIPQSVENIITKSTFKNRELRYTSALDLLADLESSLDEERKNEPKLYDNFTSSEHATTKILSTLENVNEKKASNQNYKKLALLIITLLAFVSIFVTFMNKKPDLEIEVPDIVGLSLEEARELLAEKNFEIGEIKRELDEEIDTNHIIKQNPEAKTLMKEGSIIDLVVSEGRYVVFEDYTGKNFEVIRVELESKLNITIRPEYIVDKDEKPGIILSQSIKANTKLNPHNSIDVKFVVTKANEILIPATIYGMDINSAQTLLEEMDIKVKLQPITDGTPEFLAAQIFNRVEYTSPARNSLYIQDENNYVIIYYYPEVELPQDDPIVPDDNNENGDQ